MEHGSNVCNSNNDSAPLACCYCCMFIVTCQPPTHHPMQEAWLQKTYGIPENFIWTCFFMRLFRNQKKLPQKKRITSFPSVLFVVFQAQSYSRQRGLVSGNGVGGRKRGTERGWAGEKRKFWAPLCCTVSYDFQSSTVSKGAGEGRGRRGEKGVLISANQHPPLLWLVWTA